MRRAISPAIASIFLIGIAVAGAISAGSAMFKQNEISYHSASLDVLDADLVRLSHGKTYFAGTLKNTGTVAFASVSVSLVDDSGTFHTVSSTSVLNPGDKFSDHVINDVPIVPGRKYLVHVEGVTVSGSVLKTTKMATAQG